MIYAPIIESYIQFLNHIQPIRNAKKTSVPTHIDNLKDVIWPHTVPLHCICNTHMKYYRLRNFLLHSQSLLIKPAITGNFIKLKRQNYWNKRGSKIKNWCIFQDMHCPSRQQRPYTILRKPDVNSNFCALNVSQRKRFQEQKVGFFQKKKLFSELKSGSKKW